MLLGEGHKRPKALIARGVHIVKPEKGGGNQRRLRLGERGSASEAKKRFEKPGRQKSVVDHRRRGKKKPIRAAIRKMNKQIRVTLTKAESTRFGDIFRNPKNGGKKNQQCNPANPQNGAGQRN